MDGKTILLNIFTNSKKKHRNQQPKQDFKNKLIQKSESIKPCIIDTSSLAFGLLLGSFDAQTVNKSITTLYSLPREGRVGRTPFIIASEINQDFLIS